MIIGIGTDICDIRRIDHLLQKFGTRFAEKVFTKSERACCEARSAKAACYAKRFAAKEAIAKALAGHETGALSWQDVEIVNAPSGKPEVRLYGGALDRVKAQVRARAKEPTEKETDWQVLLSLSDDAPYALAYAIVQVI